jgi:hypothetical protein
LEALGVAPLARMVISDAPWDADASRFTDAEYERSCLVTRDGDGPAKHRCHYPVLEPDGSLNVHALDAAGARLELTSSPQRSDAARKLLRFYRIAGRDAPRGVTKIARKQ